MNIAKHRKAAGLSQEEMAEKLGYARRQTIGVLEGNPEKLSIAQLTDYAAACGVTVADLLGYDSDAQERLRKIYDWFDRRPV